MWPPSLVLGGLLRFARVGGSLKYSSAAWPAEPPRWRYVGGPAGSLLAFGSPGGPALFSLVRASLWGASRPGLPMATPGTCSLPRLGDCPLRP